MMSASFDVSMQSFSLIWWMGIGFIVILAKGGEQKSLGGSGIALLDNCWTYNDAS